MATRIGSSASKHIATTRTVIPLTLENDQRRAPNATEGPNGAGHGDTMLERTLQKMRDEAPWPSGHDGAVEVALVAVVVDDYDEAIAFFVDGVGFELVEDSPAATNDGRPKRWVVVRPPGATTGILLARADGDEQRAVVGRQHAGRVGFFLRVDDFTEAHRRMTAAGVHSSASRATSSTDGSRCGWTSPAIGGICSARPRDLRGASAVTHPAVIARWRERRRRR